MLATPGCTEGVLLHIAAALRRHQRPILEIADVGEHIAAVVAQLGKKAD
jgi:hypothetical protein